MNGKITGLKIENNVLYNTFDKTGNWEETSTDKIGELEELARRLERFTFPLTSVRENIIFENEYDCGSGLVKAFKDKDGDVIYTVQHDEEEEVELDEEDAFGMDYIITQPTPSKPVAEPNHWGNTKNDTSFSSKKVKRSVLDVSSVRPGDIKSTSVKNAGDEAKSEFTGKTSSQIETYKIRKREPISKTDQISIQREKLKKIFLSQQLLVLHPVLGDRTVGKSPIYNIRYKSPSGIHVKQRGLDGAFLLSIFKYNKKKNVQNTIESKFYISEVSVHEKKSLSGRVVRKIN